jgi:hypothetical protein
MKRPALESVVLVAPGKQASLMAYFDDDGRLAVDRDGNLLDLPNGRPGKWKGRTGFLLLDAIAHARADGAKDTAAAIEILRKRKPERPSKYPDWRGYKARYLAKAYVEAKEFWRPYFARRQLGDQDKTIWFPDIKTAKKK